MRETDPAFRVSIVNIASGFFSPQAGAAGTEWAYIRIGFKGLDPGAFYYMRQSLYLYFYLKLEDKDRIH